MVSFKYKPNLKFNLRANEVKFIMRLNKGLLEFAMDERRV